MTTRNPSVPSRRPPSPRETNRTGVHLLTSPSAIRQLVRSSDVGSGDLVLDLGAGPGTLTAPLAATGARVIAIERAPHFVRRLQRRFADTPQVRVVAGDILAVPLPGRPFAVVANIPFAISTAILSRLLDEHEGVLTGADLVVEWGLARRLTGPRPRSLRAAWWAARHEMRICRRIPARDFSPASAVDAAHLAIRPRAGMSAVTRATARSLLSAAYAQPGQPAGRLRPIAAQRRRAHRILTSSGIDPPALAADIPIDVWIRLATALTDE